MRKRPKYITLRMLRSRNACPTGLDTFKETFPEGRAEVTAASIKKMGYYATFVEQFLNDPEQGRLYKALKVHPKYLEWERSHFGGLTQLAYNRLCIELRAVRARLFLKIWRGK